MAQKEKRRFAPPPFTTSKLQQAGYNRLRYTAKRTMMLAQRLYEGVELGDEGSVALITYMRTDSVSVSSDAIAQVRDHIGSSYGENYLPEKPNFFKSKKDAQEAHEAIRPTDVARTPESVRRYLDDDMFKLYQMIWQRFVASQMVPAVFDQTTIDVDAADYTFRATGSVHEVRRLSRRVPGREGRRRKGRRRRRRRQARSRVVREGEQLRLETIRPEQHFTEPPPRYTEATLVKELEEKGIGRPSTYAAIISTIVEREYVNKDQGRFTPTLLGEKVSDLLVKAFEDIFDVGFTARLEDELDEIEEGKLTWRTAVKEFWDRFAVDLDKASDEMESYKAGIPTGQKCEKCGEGELLERISRHGFFLGCSRYPECDFIRDLAEPGSGEPKARADRILRQLRQGNGHQARALRHVPCVHGLSGLQDDAAAGERHAEGAAARRGARRKVPHVRRPAAAAPRAASANSSAARTIRSASTRGRSRWASNARSATKANSSAAAPRRAADEGGSSTAAAAIPIATSPRRTSRLPSRARNAARRLSSRSAPSREISAPASAKIATGKSPHRNRPQR